MRAAWKWWMLAVLAIAATDVAILLSAGIVLAASQQMHASAISLVAAMFTDVGELVPPRVADGFGAILGVFGAGWLQQSLGPALAGSSAVPALGGVLAAPVYAVVRRRSRSGAPPAPEGQGAPPHRIYMARAETPDRVQPRVSVV